MVAGTTHVFKVHYHFENSGKKSSADYIDYVNAAAGDYNSLRTVLSGNGLLRGTGTLVIDACQSLGPGVNPAGVTSNIFQ
jgi:hypothetical protein